MRWRMTRLVCFTFFFTLFVFADRSFPQANNTVSSFTIAGGPVIGNSPQSAMGTITLNRVDGGVGSVPVTLSLNSVKYQCRDGSLPYGVGCYVLAGSNSTTVQISDPSEEVSAQTVSILPQCAYTPHPGH